MSARPRDGTLSAHRVTARAHQPSDALRFARGFLRSPAGVGSVVPSSARLERRIVRLCRASAVRTVVELGPGTGGTTRALLAALPEHARLICIELDPIFAELVRGIDDPRLHVHQGSAEDIVELLAGIGIERADVVVSGIPFSTMPEALGTRIVTAVRAALAPDGAFVAYQFRAEVARLAGHEFGAAERVELELLNVPPMRVWRWRTAGSATASAREGRASPP